ncbi:MAG: DUF4102 domain-containing protein, partial [Cytophagaceae bacterium]
MAIVTFSKTFMTTSLVCPSGKKRIEYCDRDCPGLLLEVRASTGSTPTWYVRYKQPKTKYMRLGDLGNMTLDQARKATSGFRAQLTSTPNAEVLAASTGDMTLD